jgi:hypothetical protein
MKRIISCIIFIAFVIAPLSMAYAQVSIEQQFIEVAQELDYEAQAEFLALIRDPSDLGIAVEELGIPEDFSDRLEEILPARTDGEKLDRITKKIDTIYTKVERKLANVKDHQAGKAAKILEKAVKKTAKVVVKAEKKDDKDKDETGDTGDDKEKDK